MRVSSWPGSLSFLSSHNKLVTIVLHGGSSIKRGPLSVALSYTLPVPN
jgi:fructose/tagatose bisphosphate aldolase